MERIGPMADDLDWLRDRFRNPVVDEPYDGANILSFRRAQPARDQSATALELVDQAAEVVTGIEDHARQIEARAQFLVKSALEKMHLLEDQVESAVQDLRIAQSRLATAEAQLLNAEQRTETSEARERELEYALSRIEDAIRQRLLGMGVGGKRAAVA
jgi:DNA repair exonuclease SbcCD ATPase subunit